MPGSCRIRVDEALGGIELVDAVHPAPRFPRHAHPTYAIGVVTAGLNRFRYRGAWEVAPAGALCTVTPDEPHEVEPAGDAGFAYRCLYPTVDQLRAAAEAVAGRPVRATLALPPVIADAEAARLVTRLFAAEQVRAPRLARETWLLALLARMSTRHALAPARAQERASAPRGIARARDYLAGNVAENVGLAALARIAGLDPYALVRGFTRAYALPPHAWLVQERVRRAKALLEAGSTPASAAVEVGFADQAHLTRHFRRQLGFTPGRYRRAMREARGGRGAGETASTSPGQSSRQVASQ